MVQYYTLEQAAQILRTTPDQVKEMAKRNEVRAFQDRGTLRFRAQEIDELARKRGLGSDPELQLGEALPPKSGTSPGPKPASGARPTTHVPADAGVFNFELGADDSDEVPIGKEPAPGPGKSPGRASPRPGSGKGSTKSPPPKAASDSDVRLVMDGSDLDFNIVVDSDVSVAKDPASGPGKSPGKKSRAQPAEPGGDSGVRIVPLDQPSDSDVKIEPPGDDDAISHERAKTPSDSDIRLEESKGPGAPAPGSDDALVTEEIDLDAEARKAAEAGKSKTGKPRPRSKVDPAAALPTSSPFELSDADISIQAPKSPGKGPKSPGKGPKTPPKGPKTPEKKAKSPEDKEGETDSSSDFELTPLNTPDSSPLELGSSGEVPIMTDDDEVSLGELTGAGGGSGINLREPVDSGISLEQGGSDELEFELSLDAGSTPKPAPAAGANVDSSSEFELSLQDEDSSPMDSSPTTDDSDSEFELSLDADSAEVSLNKTDADSSSEFELTLDEEGGLAPVEESSPTEESGEQDIFETDFEVPALDEESGSEAVALDEADTDLESSDFDLALNEEEPSSEEGASESQVVALEDEEEADAGAATVARPRHAAAAGAEEGLADIEEDLEGEPEEEAEAEEEVAAAAPARAAEPTPWGPVPGVVLLFGSIFLFLGTLMSFELVRGLWGYHSGSKVSKLVIDPIGRLFDDTLPKD